MVSTELMFTELINIIFHTLLYNDWKMPPKYFKFPLGELSLPHPDPNLEIFNLADNFP